MRPAKNFGIGFRHIFEGLRYLTRHPRLWIYALAPTIINLALLGLLLGTFVHYYHDIYGWLSGIISPMHLQGATAWYEHVLNWLLWAGGFLLQFVLVIIALILLLILFYVLGFITSAPFNDLLSERVEAMVTGIRASDLSFRQLLSEAWRSIKVEIVKAIFFLGVPLLLIALALIPVLGGPLYSVSTLLFAMFDLGFNYVDYPMSRKGLPLGERMRFARKHAGVMIGFGAPIVIPFANLVLMAPMVVGGTILYLKLNDQYSTNTVPTNVQ